MTKGKTRLFSTLFAGAAFAACLTGAALAAEPAANADGGDKAAEITRTEQLLSANDTVLADVRVVGRRTRATDQALRLSTTRASSSSGWSASASSKAAAACPRSAGLRADDSARPRYATPRSKLSVACTRP